MDSAQITGIIDLAKYITDNPVELSVTSHQLQERWKIFSQHRDRVNHVYDQIAVHAGDFGFSTNQIRRAEELSEAQRTAISPAILREPKNTINLGRWGHPSIAKADLSYPGQLGILMQDDLEPGTLVQPEEYTTNQPFGTSPSALRDPSSQANRRLIYAAQRELNPEGRASPLSRPHGPRLPQSKAKKPKLANVLRIICLRPDTR
jgi:hypothetical protein